MKGKPYISISSALALSVLAACASQLGTAPSIPPSAVIGVRDAQLAPDYWIARDASARRLVLDSEAIAAQNARLREIDPSVRDLEKLAPTLAAADVKQWIEKLSVRPDEALFDSQGHALSATTLDELMNSLALDAVPPTQPTHYGMVVKRADLRTFPTLQRVYNSRDNTD